MTTVAVMAEPPVAGVAGTELAADQRLSEADGASLYGAMLADVVAAVAESGAELLVNYRPADRLPAAVEDPVEPIREALAPVVTDPTALRYEPQVGSTFAARVGNTVTHLLDSEGVRTAAFVTPAVPSLGRQQIDSAAMKLRRHDVVLGPSTDGRVYYGGFAEPIDFADAFATPALTTLVERAAGADRSTDFLPTLPVVERPADLLTALPLLWAHRRAGRPVPSRTLAVLEALDLDVVDADGRPALADRNGDDRR